MTNHPLRTIRVLFSITGLLMLNVLQNAMASNPPLELTLALEPERAVVPGERIRVLVSVATPRWFTAGTQLRLPEISGVVLLQNQEFASNATERRGQESWTLQHWSIDAFATRAGNFILQPIEVTASVSVAPGSDKTFTLYTKPRALRVVVPQALANLDGPWIASPSVTLTQHMDNDDTVAVGAAIKREVSIDAENVMAMMLPSLTRSELATRDALGGGVKSANIPGLQSYPEPVLLSNKATRGELTAKRVETVVYIATEPGEVHIPAEVLYWWNTTDATLQTLTTPEVRFTVRGTAAVPTGDAENMALPLGWLALLIVSMTTAYWLWRSPLRPIARQRLIELSNQLGHALHALRANPLPDRLNPGGTPAGPLAEPQHQRDSSCP